MSSKYDKVSKKVHNCVIFGSTKFFRDLLGVTVSLLMCIDDLVMGY